ncbi:hypothetical protein DACRYDRAFT_106190 [Dacryopinax primogenitus]|uniref:Uncharacterized protein n=1 Tax=Dacryopinax primogenitus (strain DJM 731) TaxID=1858805 RepID=M5GAM2_DACPD|nr:uncharacterized protein DACRYDRAFT_106190 [Dacryopinax primogenitus]EJU03012.1 hypothetical protein DACRYDRAFT_106190 [Dacryopinax primogenitus]
MPRASLPESPLTTLPQATAASNKRRLARAPHLLYPSTTNSISSISSLDDVLPEPKRGLLDFRASTSAPSGEPPLLKEKRKRSGNLRKALDERSPNNVDSFRRTHVEVALRDTPDAVFTVTTRPGTKSSNTGKNPKSNNPFSGDPSMPVVNRSTTTVRLVQPTAGGTRKARDEHPSIARPSRPATRVFSPSPPPAVNFALLTEHATKQALGFPYIQPEPEAEEDITIASSFVGVRPGRGSGGRARTMASEMRLTSFTDVPLQDDDIVVENVRLSVRPIPPTLGTFPSVTDDLKRSKGKKSRHLRKPPPPISQDVSPQPSPPRPFLLPARRPPTPHPMNLSAMAAEAATIQAEPLPDEAQAQAQGGVLAALSAYLFPGKFVLPPPVTASNPSLRQSQPAAQTQTHARTASTLSSTAATEAILAHGRSTYCSWPAAAFFSALVCWAWEVLFRPRARGLQKRRHPFHPSAQETKQGSGQPVPPRARWPEGATLVTEIELSRGEAARVAAEQGKQRDRDLERGLGSAASTPGSDISEVKRRLPPDPEQGLPDGLPELAYSAEETNWRAHQSTDQEGTTTIWSTITGVWKSVGGWGWGWGRGKQGEEMRAERV